MVCIRRTILWLMAAISLASFVVFTFFPDFAHDQHLTAKGPQAASTKVNFQVLGMMFLGLSLMWGRLAQSKTGASNNTMVAALAGSIISAGVLVYFQFIGKQWQKAGSKDQAVQGWLALNVVFATGCLYSLTSDEE